jgi:hypothetical protein
MSVSIPELTCQLVVKLTHSLIVFSKGMFPEVRSPYLPLSRNTDEIGLRPHCFRELCRRRRG